MLVTHRLTAALLVLVLASCQTARVRPELRPGDPVAVVVLPAKPPPPDSSLMLVNPLGCLDAFRGSSGTWGLIVGLLCFPVLGAVDLVALPVLIAAQGEAKAAFRAWACASTSPAEHAAEVLGDGIVTGRGMVRAEEKGSESPAARTFRVEVSTERFVRSDTVNWTGRARLLDPTGKVVWEDECEVGKRAEDSTEIACNGAEADVLQLGDICARRWLDALSAAGAPQRGHALAGTVRRAVPGGSLE
jgi:hypothetical protein